MPCVPKMTGLFENIYYFISINFILNSYYLNVELFAVSPSTLQQTVHLYRLPFLKITFFKWMCHFWDTLYKYEPYDLIKVSFLIDF